MKSTRLTAALVLCLTGISAPAYAAWVQVSGNSFFNFNGASNEFVSHQTGYVFNTNTTLGAAVIASLPFAATTGTPRVTFYVRNNGQAMGCMQQAINASTFSTMFTNGETSANGNTTIVTQLSIPSPFHMHGGSCTMPKMVSGISARVYGAIMSTTF